MGFMFSFLIFSASARLYSGDMVTGGGCATHTINALSWAGTKGADECIEAGCGGNPCRDTPGHLPAVIPVGYLRGSVLDGVY